MALCSPVCVFCCGFVLFTLFFNLTSADSQPGVPYLEGRQDPCSGYICLNGGSCVSNTGQPACTCAEGFTGFMCQTVVSAPVRDGTCPHLPANANGQCSGYVCSNDAVCPGSEKCCPTGCSTRVCAAPVSSARRSVAQEEGPEQTSACDNFCLNGGTCVETGGLAVCTCMAGFVGERCDTALPDPANKSGICPFVPADLKGHCPGTVCSDDAICPGAQKCCKTACSTGVCTDPVPESARCDTMKCSFGSTCLVVRTSASDPGQATCVLDVDRTCWASGFSRAHLIPSLRRPGQFDSIPCGRHMWFGQTCPRGTRCSWSGIAFPSICCSQRRDMGRFQNMYWAQRLRLSRREAGEDPCGGCPVGQRCQTVDVQCVTPPCITYQCIDVTEEPQQHVDTECPLQCPPNHKCLLRPTPCEVNHSSSSSSNNNNNNRNNRGFRRRGINTGITYDALNTGVSNDGDHNSHKACDPSPRPTCVSVTS